MRYERKTGWLRTNKQYIYYTNNHIGYTVVHYTYYIMPIITYTKHIVYIYYGMTHVYIIDYGWDIYESDKSTTTCDGDL